MAPMTHHYSTLTTEDWLESDQARTDFLDWLAGYAPDQLADHARTALIGWAPLDRLASLETCREWLHELRPTHPAVTMLYGRYIDDWLDCPYEHRAFHRWADRTDNDILCGGCWT